jgi:hypothetical protein
MVNNQIGELQWPLGTRVCLCSGNHRFHYAPQRFMLYCVNLIIWLCLGMDSCGTVANQSAIQSLLKLNSQIDSRS